MNNDHTWNNYEYSGSYTIAQPPKVVGWWLLYPQASPYNQFAMYHKPTDEQIKNTEQLLGWGWKDAT
jgi:hypothetical protein